MPLIISRIIVPILEKIGLPFLEWCVTRMEHAIDTHHLKKESRKAARKPSEDSRPAA